MTLQPFTVVMKKEQTCPTPKTKTKHPHTK